MKRGFPIIILIAGLLSSCERSVDSPQDIDYSRPFLHDLQIFPETFNTDTILVNGQANPEDVLSLSLNCVVVVDETPGSGPSNVRYSVNLPSEERRFAEGVLRDDGVNPDLGSRDGIFTGTVTFSIRRVDIGAFELSVDGYNEPGSPSNTLRRQIGVFRSSRPPVISDLAAPDTINLPSPGNFSLILLSISVADSDGQGDIAAVYFRNLDSPTDTTRKFILLDDGHPTGASGDSVANDGTFSIIIQLPSSTPAGTFRFKFESTDRSGLVSNAILHPLTVLGPE